MKSIGELILDYIQYLRAMHYSAETIRKTGEKLRSFGRWLRETSNVESIEKLRPEQLTRWHQYLSTVRTAKGYPLKASTINRHIIAVRGFLIFLARNGYVQSRVLDNLPYVKEPKRLPGSVLTHEQVKSLLTRIPTDTPEGYRDRTMFELLYSTGIRAGELLRLDVQDMDLKNHTALINGKGNKQRVVPIGKTARQYVMSYIVAIRPYLVREKTERALFLGRNGGRLSYGVLRRMVLAVVGRSGLEVEVTAHTFRRSCTTELIRGGANMYHVKELLGHESLDTLRHYARLTITDLKKTHEKCHPRERENE